MPHAMSPIERAEQELKAIESQFTVAPQQPDQQAPQQQPEFQAQQQPQQSQPPAEQKTDDYYQRWKSLDGMLKNKDEQISQLMQSNTELMQKFETLLQKPAEPQQPELKLDDFSSQYGEDTVEAIAKVAASMFGSRLTALEERVNELAGVAGAVHTLAADQRTVKQENFRAGLKAQVSDFEQIIETQEWDTWLLNTTDEISGLSYKQLFDAANDGWNMGTMVALFNRFKATKPAAPSHQHDPRAGLVAPGGGSSASAPTSGVDPNGTWTESEIMQAYENHRRGMYTADHWAKIDSEIMKAYAENRVIVGR